MELHPSDFDLVSTLRDLSVMFQARCEAKRLAWQVQLPEPEAIPVHADDTKLSQVLMNLLGNACKFTDEGSVTLRVTSVEGHGGSRVSRSPIPDPLLASPPQPLKAPKLIPAPIFSK